VLQARLFAPAEFDRRRIKSLGTLIKKRTMRSHDTILQSANPVTQELKLNASCHETLNLFNPRVSKTILLLPCILSRSKDSNHGSLTLFPRLQFQTLALWLISLPRSSYQDLPGLSFRGVPLLEENLALRRQELGQRLSQTNGGSRRRKWPYRDFSECQFAKPQLRVSSPVSKYVETHVKPWRIRSFSQELHACKSPKPQGLEESPRLESLDRPPLSLPEGGRERVKRQAQVLEAEPRQAKDR